MIKGISRHKIIIILIIQTIANIAYSQSNANSLKRVWENDSEADSLRFKAINKYYLTHTHSQPDSALVLINYHYNLAYEKNSKIEMANALNEKSYAYYLKGDTKNSMEFLRQSIKLLEQLNCSIKLATVYSNLGNIYAEENKYQEALRYHHSSLKIFRQEGVEKGEARMLNNLGITYSLSDNFDLALDHLNESLELNIKLNRKNKTGPTLYSIGNVYYKKGNYTLAIEFGKKALEILISQNNKVSASNCYFLFAKAYQNLEQFEKAYEYVEKSLLIDYEIKNKSKIIERLTLKANLTFESDPEEATKQAEGILKLIQKDTKNQLLADLYQLLYKCYKVQKKFSSSLFMHEKYTLYRDSVTLEKNNLSIIKEAIQKDFEEKLLQNKIKQEEERAALKLQHKYKIYGIVLTMVFFISLITMKLRKQILDSRRKKEALLEEIERLKVISTSSIPVAESSFNLDRNKIELHIGKNLNETDWKVLNILLNDPIITNKDLAEKAFMSVHGIGSSLRRMYISFDISESKYMKISLLLEAVKLSNHIL